MSLSANAISLPPPFTQKTQNQTSLLTNDTRDTIYSLDLLFFPLMLQYLPQLSFHSLRALFSLLLCSHCATLNALLQVTPLFVCSLSLTHSLTLSLITCSSNRCAQRIEETILVYHAHVLSQYHTVNEELEIRLMNLFTVNSNHFFPLLPLFSALWHCVDSSSRAL